MPSIAYVDQCADLVGTVAGPFAITGGSNDTLTITVDGGAPQSFTLTAGAARTAAQIVADINAVLTGGTAYATGAWTSHPQPSRVRIQTTSTNAASSTILIGAPANNANATLGFTAGTVTGFPRVNATWTSVLNTKQELINQIETQLLAAGWSTVSGHATTNLLMQSALTPPGQDMQMRLRVKDNAGSCVTLSVENVAGSVAGGNSTTNGAFLLPASAKVWRFIGNKYQFWIHPPQPYGYNQTNAIRGFAGFGVISLPSFLQGGSPGIAEAFWLSSSARTDTDTSAVAIALNSTLGHYYLSGVNIAGNYQVATNGSMIDLASGSPNAGTLTLCQLTWGWPFTAASEYQWHDGGMVLVTALIGWAISSPTGTGQWRGQVWDGFIATETFMGDQVITYDSHSFIALTDFAGSYNTNPIQVGFRGTLFVAVP